MVESRHLSPIPLSVSLADVLLQLNNKPVYVSIGKSHLLIDP